MTKENLVPVGFEADEFVHYVTDMSFRIHEIAKSKGFWEEGLRRNKGELIALMHAELSEALEAAREKEPKPDKHLPNFDNEVVEFADTVIRIMDYCAAFDLPLGEAILQKAAFNATRPHKHGKKF